MTDSKLQNSIEGNKLGLRESRNGHQSHTIWLTGLSGSGKTTLALAVESDLLRRGMQAFVLDGDKVRMGLNQDLDFSINGRAENLRRIAEVAKLMNQAGLIVIAAFISPFEKDRRMVESIIGSTHYSELFIDCPIQVCEERDVKGLYQKAKNGSIKEFTGLDSPYEIPHKSVFSIKTHELSIEECTSQILEFILPKLALE
ncbi:MAG: adenylyl-sulfate kinase [Bacteroidetes bacterium]|nr:MAG: adenylyl-sulfate kinase [Bacteroidota bacterium]